jgi:hypothetical protein
VLDVGLAVRELVVVLHRAAPAVTNCWKIGIGLIVRRNCSILGFEI